MSQVRSRHFTLTEANALLPDLRAWLSELWRLDRLLTPLASELRPLLQRATSHNIGGPQLEIWLTLSLRWHHVLNQILGSGVLIKDLARGLVDFPHRLADGREVLLCWEPSEPEIAYYHGLDDGFAGRRALDDLA